jgi:membrane protease YdiL (CAAX protease family)
MRPIFLAADGRVRAGWRFLLGAVGVVAAELGSAYIAAFIAAGSGRLFTFLQEPLALLFMMLIFSFLLTIGDRVEEGRLSAQGLPFSAGWLRQGFDGFLFGAAMVTVCVVTLRLAGEVTFEVHAGAFRALAAALVFGLLAVGAMKEEVAFRGYPFQRLLEAGGPRWGPVLGIAVLSLLFGGVHWWNPDRTPFSTANTVLIGVVFAVAYLRTRALWLPFGIHFGWNFMLGVVFGLPVSGIEEFSVIVKGHAAGPLWLTGGAYGIEASAVATVVSVLSILPIVLLYRPGAAKSGGAPDLVPGTLANQPVKGND